MITQDELKQRIVAALDTLTPDDLHDMATYLEYLRFRQQQPALSTPFSPIKLGGLWAGVSLTDDEIAGARREVWSSLEEENG